MYQKDKNHRITLRLNENQFEFVRENAEALDVSPSDFLRMVINSTMSATKKVQSRIAEISQNLLEENGRENDKSNIYNQL